MAVGGIAVVGLAAPAYADPGDKWNYGHCVSGGWIDPSSSPLGPTKMKPNGKYTGAVNAHEHGGNDHFDAGIACPKS